MILKNSGILLVSFVLFSCGGEGEEAKNEDSKRNSMKEFDVSSIDDACGCAKAIKNITNELFNSIEDGMGEEEFENLPDNKILIEKYDEVDDYCDDNYDISDIKDCPEYAGFKVNMEKIEEKFR